MAVRITIPNAPTEAQKYNEAVHRDRGDGTPRCGQPLRGWKGLPAYYKMTRAKVTCEKCLRWS